MADQLIAEIEDLETQVEQLLEGVGTRGVPESRLREALAEAVYALVESGEISAADLTSGLYDDQITRFIEEIFGEYSAELQEAMTETIRSVADLVEAFYERRGISTEGLREAVRRSTVSQTLSDAFISGMQQVQLELRTATTDELLAQISSGALDSRTLATAIADKSGASLGYARTQAQAAVGAYNLAHRNTLAKQAGLDHFQYFGTIMARTRHFCRIHLLYVYPENRIEQMRNGMLEPVKIFKGGWRCRHSWLAVDPSWSDELARKVVDEDPTDVTDPVSKRTITVIAPVARVQRLKRQITLSHQGYERFLDAENDDSGFVAIHRDWDRARLATRRGSKKRAVYDTKLDGAKQRAERGEEALVNLPAAQKPAGTPVGRALTGPRRGKTKAALQNAVDAIDAVHGDGPLPTISVKSNPNLSSLGRFLYTKAGDPVMIELSDPDSPEHTLLHEIGHFIDLAGLPGPTFGSASTSQAPALNEWLKAVEASNAITLIRSSPRLPSKAKAYLLDPREMWARSYAQYITVRSGRADLKQQLGPSPEQWDESDFAPIADAFDALFEQLGWRQ